MFVGQRVEVLFDGEWFTGNVVAEVGDGRWEMTCDGYPGEITTGHLDDFRPLNDDIYVGLRVLVLYEGAWYSGEALEEVEDCRWEVQCDDDPDGEITTSSDVRPEDTDDMYSSSSSDDDASRQQWLQDDVDDVRATYNQQQVGRVCECRTTIAFGEKPSSIDNFVISWNKDSNTLNALCNQVTGRPWQDEDFPNHLSAAKNEERWVPAQIAPVLNGCVSAPKWAQLFQSVSPLSVQQGSLGDCWLMAAISSLCEFPQLIHDCFPNTDKISQDGMYTVRLFDPVDNFRKHYVQVNDMIPFYPGHIDIYHGGRTEHSSWMPVYAKPTRNEIFVVLLEKAVCKFLHQGHAGGKPDGWLAAEFGDPRFGIAMLTGCRDSLACTNSWRGQWSVNKVTKSSCKTDYMIRNECTLNDNQMFYRLKELDENGAMLSCFGIPGGQDARGRELKMDDGLCSGHAYSLIAVKETSAGKMVQIRNPHGDDSEWNGEFSDSSGFWSSQLGRQVAAEVKYVPKYDDGLFWMPWHRFCQRWGNVSINMTAVPRRDFRHEFSEKFMNMVERRNNGRFNGPTDIETEALRYYWDTYTAPYRGFLDRSQLLELLKILHMPPADEYGDMDATYQEFDQDRDGWVGWDDFLNEMVHRVGTWGLY